MLDVIDAMLRKLCYLLMFVVGFFILLMMVNITADVLLKLLFNAPLHGTSELVGNYYMTGIVFLSIPLAELENRQIYVDLFYNLVSRPLQLVSLALVFVLQIGFFGVLGYESLMDAFEAMQKREIVEGYYRMVIWPARFMLPLGLALAVMISALRLIQVIARHSAAEKLLTNNSPSQNQENV